MVEQIGLCAIERRWLMKVGDLVKVKNSFVDIDDVTGVGVLIKKMGHQFWTILWKGKTIMMHEDYMGVIDDSR